MSSVLDYPNWILSHAADLEQLLALGKKDVSDFPTAGGVISIGLWIHSHGADVLAAEALIAKIASDFPGRKVALEYHQKADLHAQLVAAAVASNHPFLDFITSHGPEIIALIEQIIAAIHPAP